MFLCLLLPVQYSQRSRKHKNYPKVYSVPIHCERYERVLGIKDPGFLIDTIIHVMKFTWYKIAQPYHEFLKTYFWFHVMKKVQQLMDRCRADGPEIVQRFRL